MEREDGWRRRETSRHPAPSTENREAERREERTRRKAENAKTHEGKMGGKANLATAFKCNK